jgi:hypothetical protein
MGATSHFAPLYDTAKAGHRVIYWIILVVIVAGFEAIALSAPAVGDAIAFHIDKHKNTIISGLGVWVVLMVFWEILFKR